MSNQCLDVQQMQHLQELGLDTSNASMALCRYDGEVEKGNDIDKDTGCLHIAQVAWNAIAMLHFKMEELKGKENAVQE